jgi:hypothetical protein
MSLPTLTLDSAMRLAAAIAAMGILWDTFELATARTDLLDRFFDWRVVRSRYYILVRRPVLKAAFDTVLSGRVFQGLVLAHGAAAIAFVAILPVSRPAAAVLAAVVLAGHLSIHLRLLVGMDGADQMQTVVWTGLLVYAVDLGPVANTAAAIFICAQLVLSYIVSGSAKLFSRTWRSGTAIARITRTGTYCSPGVSGALQFRLVSLTVCWAVIVWEVFGSAALLGGHVGLLAFVAAGAAFHIGIALSMSLTTFVFAFLAAYPVLYAVLT